VSAPNRNNILPHYEYLKKWENKVVSNIKNIDWNKINPVVAVCENKEDFHIFNYLRLTTSYIKQGMNDSKQSRATRLVVLDSNTGGILGIILHADIYDRWSLRDNYIGWLPELRSKNINKILHVQRALPLIGFGKYLLGKLLILLSISREVIKYMSLKYSQPICAITISGLGLKRYPYCERLHGIEFVGYHNKSQRECALYICETMKGGYRHLRGEIPEEKLKIKTNTIIQNVKYWKERWLNPRLEKIENNSYDLNFYKLDNLLEIAN